MSSLEAGICDITGSFGYYCAAINGQQSGAFSLSTSTMRKGNSGSDVGAVHNFSAANSNSIYGNSETVTPLSLSILFCIKYE